MSRYGKIPVPLLKGAEVKKVDNKVTAKGPKGQIELDMKEGVELTIEQDQVLVDLTENTTLSKAMHGLYRSLVNNMVIGVTKGFEKRLSLVGVGYRATVSGNQIDLQLGFSHPTRLDIPKGVEIKVEKATTIIVSGVDKQLVGQFAATIRSIRPPEPYKGKGVRYEDEHVRKKAGKAAKGK